MIITALTLDVQMQLPVHTKMNLPIPGWRQTECTECAGSSKTVGTNVAPTVLSIPSTYLKSLALTYEMVGTGSVILQLTISRRTSTTGQASRARNQCSYRSGPGQTILSLLVHYGRNDQKSQEDDRNFIEMQRTCNNCTKYDNHHRKYMVQQ